LGGVCNAWGAAAHDGRSGEEYASLGSRYSAPRLWEHAGVGPGDMDFAQIYDCFTISVLEQLEDLGFCKKGEGPDFVRQNTFTADGSFPFNTSGGQLSGGQAGAAGGFLGLVEVIRQVTGQSLGAKVPDARLGLASGFGMINYDRGLCSGAAILAAGQ
jgi:acetyl-CoA acetyltransferase